MAPGPPGGQPGSPATSATATGPYASVRIGRYAGRVGRHGERRTVDDQRDPTGHTGLGRGVPRYGTPPGSARVPRSNGTRARGRARTQRDTTASGRATTCSSPTRGGNHARYCERTNSPTDTEGRAPREKSDTDDAHSDNPANADERTDTDAEKTRAWEEDVHIGAEDSTVRSEIMDMLSEFKDMWSCRLGKIGATKHRIELKPGARPIYQAPYQAGPIAREKEKTEIDRMLRAGVIEPTSAEWASPAVFVPKKDGTMPF